MEIKASKDDDDDLDDCISQQKYEEMAKEDLFQADKISVQNR